MDTLTAPAVDRLKIVIHRLKVYLSAMGRGNGIHFHTHIADRYSTENTALRAAEALPAESVAVSSTM